MAAPRALGSRPSRGVAAVIAIALGAACGARAWAEGDPGDTAAAATTAVADRQGPAELAAERDELKKRVASREASNTAALARLAKRQDEVRRERATYRLKSNNPWQRSKEDDAVAAEAEIQELYRKIRVSHRVAARAAREADQIDRALAADQTTLAAWSSDSRNDSRRNGVVRLLGCGLFAVAAVAPLLQTRRRRLRAR